MKPLSTYSLVLRHVVSVAIGAVTCTVSAEAPCAPSRHAERQSAFRVWWSVVFIFNAELSFKEHPHITTPGLQSHRGQVTFQ